MKFKIVLPKLVMANGTLEALKWLALIMMTGDHINKYLFNDTLPYLYEAGRLAMPLFVFVLAYNLARPGAFDRGVYQRVMSRLLIFGALATFPFLALGGLMWEWWPLNILFALWVVTAGLYLIERNTVMSYVAAVGLMLVGGGLVEFWWPALVMGGAAWSYCKRPSWVALIFYVVALTAFWFVSGNLWALAAFPVICLASRMEIRIPRMPWAFYMYYPAHLAVLFLIRIPMSKAGYLFF